MKLGCCAYSYRDLLTSGAMTYEGFLDTCADLGFDGVELTTYYLPDVSRAGLNDLKRACVVRGLEISGAAIGTDLCQPDAAARRGDIEKAKEWLPRAAALGAPFLRVFAGGVREGDTEEGAFARCVAALEELLPVARSEGVIVGLENHGGITGTAEQVLRIVRAIGDNPWFGINLDTGNYREPEAEFALTIPHTVTVHAKSHYQDSAGEKREVNWALLREALAARGYRGFLNIEYEEPEDPRTAVPAFLANLASTFRG